MAKRGDGRSSGKSRESAGMPPPQLGKARASFNERTPLSQTIKDYFARIGSPSDDVVAKRLAHRLQRERLSVGLINQWRNGHKPPSRRQLVEIARFICELGEERDDPISLDTVIYELLRDAGMSFDTPDFMGDALSEMQLEAPRSGGSRSSYWVTSTEAEKVQEVRLAAVNAPPFIDIDGNGLCGEIASYVVRLMGGKPHWVPTNWENQRSMLESGKVDLIPPILLIVPQRIREFAFSDPIGLLADFKAIVPKNGSKACVEVERGVKYLNPSKVEVVSIAGEIGQLFCRLAGATRSAEESVTHADAGVRLVQSSRRWEKGQLVPALVSERITCDSIVAQYRDELEGAELRPAHRMRFPFAFGMRYGEPTLLREINIAIEIIKQTGILKEFILGYSDQFAGRVLVDGNFPEPMTLDALRESTSAK